MTRDEVISMWNAAGAFDGIDLQNEIKLIEIFAALVAAAEREACAKVCDEYDVAEDVNSSDTAEGIALAIRARGKND